MDRDDNVFFEFEVPDQPTPDQMFKLYIKNESGKKLLNRIHGFDYGIIIRLDNKHEHDQVRNCVYFVCAGLGSTGTSGACFYLANNWKKLFKEFGRNEFGLLLKVRRGAETDIERLDTRISGLKVSGKTES